MSLRNYMDLVHVSVEVDTSELQERLDHLGALDEDRVRELIAEDGMTAESVRDILSDEGLLNMSDTYVESDDLDDRVQSVLDNTDFESRISVLEGLNTCNVDVNGLADLPGGLDDLTARVESLEAGKGLEPWEERIDLLSKRVAELETTLASRPAVQGMSLFDL